MSNLRDRMGWNERVGEPKITHPKGPTIGSSVRNDRPSHGEHIVSNEQTAAETLIARSTNRRTNDTMTDEQTDLETARADLQEKIIAAVQPAVEAALASPPPDDDTEERYFLEALQRVCMGIDPKYGSLSPEHVAVLVARYASGQQRPCLDADDIEANDVPSPESLLTDMFMTVSWLHRFTDALQYLVLGGQFAPNPSQDTEPDTPVSP